MSTTADPFAPNFAAIPLSLLDAGNASERYTFQMQQTKTVIPSVALTSDNTQSNCYFRATTFTASLYTKMNKTYPPTDVQGSWPFAVRMEQVSGGGTDTPQCYHRNEDGSDGAEITGGLTAEAGGDLCSCLYRNWRT